MRIYEVNQYFHIDLAKVASIRQLVDKAKQLDIYGNTTRYNYHYWVEVIFSGGNNVEINCNSIEEAEDTYNMLLLAWMNHTGDLPTPTTQTATPQTETQ